MFVQRIYALGPLLSDLTFVTVVLVPTIPAGRWIVIGTGIIDGFFGRARIILNMHPGADCKFQSQP